MTTRHAWIFSTAFIGITLASALHADQRRQAPGADKVPVEVSLKVGGEAFDAKGQGSCTHAAKASIYNVPAEMWTVRHEEDPRSVQLTLWKPADGSAAMFSLSANGKKTTTISTVRGGEISGGGTVTLEPTAKGGTFRIDAKGKSGDAVTGTIKCDAFTPAIAEGGD